MNSIQIGTNREGKSSDLLLKMANRHGLVTGATGTGKTVTLQIMAEQFSQAGVPVILTDVKGDLSGFSAPGKTNKIVEERVALNKIENFQFQNFPCQYWDVFGENGIPLRTSLSEMGPLLLARVLGLNETQTDILNIVFKYADDENMKLVDLKDLKAVLQFCGEQQEDLKLTYGNIAPQSVAAMVRKVVNLESKGGEKFFTEPSVDIKHMVRTSETGQGVINLIDGKKLMLDKSLYSSFLLWILSEVFEEFPEVGDPDQPKLVMFFDEAHLLFDDAPDFLMEKMQTVVRLVRSKGVGLYFVTQSPADIDPEILGQLGNKIQHGLRASSEKDRKLVKAIAKNYPSDEGFDVEAAILELGMGESLTTCLNEKGVPQPVQLAIHRPPSSQIGPIEEAKKKDFYHSSPFYSLYEKAQDPESAFEKLEKVRKEMAEAEEKAQKEQQEQKKTTRSSGRQSATEAFFKSMVRTVGRTLGRELMRGILGSIKR